MKIRNTATGQIGHVPNNDPTVLGLVQAGLLEIIQPPPAPPPLVPVYYVGMGPIGEPVLVFKCGRETQQFFGNPDEAATIFGKSRVPPQEIIDQYRAARETHARATAATEVAALNRNS